MVTRQARQGTVWSNAVNACCPMATSFRFRRLLDRPWCQWPFCCVTFIESFHLLLASEDSALRRVRLLWPLLTSLLLSRRIAPTVVRCVRTRAETSSGKTCLLLSDPADLPPSVPDNYWASPSLAGFPTLKRPYIHFLISTSCASHPRFRHRLSSDPALRTKPLLRRMVPVITVHGGLAPLECKSY